MFLVYIISIPLTTQYIYMQCVFVYMYFSFSFVAGTVSAGAHEHREAVRRSVQLTCIVRGHVLNPNTSSTITINGDQPDT